MSLPHTQTTAEYIACAYTQKVRRFCDMMSSLGHEVFLYASEDNEADVAELVTVVSKVEQQEWFGGNDFHINFFNIEWDSSLPYWVTMNSRCVDEISARLQPKDFVCLIGGVCQQLIGDAFSNTNPVVEFGIGYRGVFAPFKVFESYPHMHFVYGVQNNDNGKFYDAVIPNYFDPDEFTFSDVKDNYFAFLGRFIERKGVEIAIEVARRLDTPLIMAGQGAVQRGSRIESVESGRGFDDCDHVTHIGHVNVEERAKLLSKAKALLVPTTYLEPFGGVHVEAMMSGTPVIVPDFGVFCSTVDHGRVGFRFRTIGEAVRGASRVGELDAAEIRRYAVDNFSTDRVKWLYEDYFVQLHGLYSGEDFYTNNFGRDDRYSIL